MWAAPGLSGEEVKDGRLGLVGRSTQNEAEIIFGKKRHLP